MSRRTSSRRTTTKKEAFPELAPGVQAGLKRLIEDHSKTVAKMLQQEVNDDTKISEKANTMALCEKCASVMRQQQLNPSQFLARFFDIGILQQHVKLLNKSTKGSAIILSERIETAWLKNTPIINAAGTKDLMGNDEKPDILQKKRASNDESEELTSAGRPKTAAWATKKAKQDST